MEKTEKVEQQEKRELTLEERRLNELRKELVDKVDAKLLDEFIILYTTMILRYASTLKINFDNLEEPK
tara:strand:+ start:243 stop:446 length:204 start_codon:yes stop_codon:yes gene_type:complete